MVEQMIIGEIHEMVKNIYEIDIKMWTKLNNVEP